MRRWARKQIHGRAGGLFDVEQSFSGRDLWEPVRLADSVGARCGRVGGGEAYPGVMTPTRRVA